jgi:hypothetical protein
MVSGRGEIYLQGVNLDAAHEFLKDYGLISQSWVPHSGVLGDLFKLSAMYFCWLDTDTSALGTPSKEPRMHAVVSPNVDGNINGAGAGKTKTRYESTLLEEVQLDSHLTFQQVSRKML